MEATLGTLGKKSLPAPSARSLSRPVPEGFKTEAGEWTQEAKDRFFGAKNEEASTGA